MIVSLFICLKQGDAEPITMERNEVYHPDPATMPNKDYPNFAEPRNQAPIEAQPFRALETPFLHNIKLVRNRMGNIIYNIYCNMSGVRELIYVSTFA